MDNKKGIRLSENQGEENQESGYQGAKISNIE
jgi:hypothetical protein